MPTMPKSKLILALLAVAALLALPAAANATLSYTKGLQKPRVYVAEDNGKGARAIGVGRNSHVSPDGEWIAFTSAHEGYKDEALLHPHNPQSYGDIYIMRADGSDIRMLTDDPYEEGTPSWFSVAPAR